MANNYSTIAQFQTFSPVSGSFGAQPDATIQYFLDYAGDEIDAALRPRHPLPLASVPTMLTQWVIVLASWRLLELQGLNPSSQNDFLRSAYVEIRGTPDNAYSGLLSQLATGKMSIGHSIDASSPSPTPMFPIVSGNADRHWAVCDPLTRREVLIG